MADSNRPPHRNQRGTKQPRRVVHPNPSAPVPLSNRIAPVLASAVEHVSIESIKAYERKLRRHSDRQVAQIAWAMREFGFNNPIIVDGAGVVVAGHGRLLAALELGLEVRRNCERDGAGFAGRERLDIFPDIYLRARIIRHRHRDVRARRLSLAFVGDAHDHLRAELIFHTDHKVRQQLDGTSASVFPERPLRVFTGPLGQRFGGRAGDNHERGDDQKQHCFMLHLLFTPLRIVMV